MNRLMTRHGPWNGSSRHRPPVRSALRLTILEDRTVPSGTQMFAVGAAPGGVPRVQVYMDNGAKIADFYAFDRSFTGGVHVAVGDVNGDGFDDLIVAAGAGGGPHVKVFKGGSNIGGTTTNEIDISAPLVSFYAFSAGFSGGVWVSSGDLNGDGFADVIVGAGVGGGPHVKLLAATHDGTTFTGLDVNNPLASFYAFGANFTGGVRVAAASGMFATAAGAGGGPHVKVFQTLSGGAFVAPNPDAPQSSFFAYSANFLGGVFVALGDVYGDGNIDVITGAGAGGGPDVRVFQNTGGAKITATPSSDFFAAPATYTGGVDVGTVRVGSADRIITGLGPFDLKPAGTDNLALGANGDGAPDRPEFETFDLSSGPGQMVYQSGDINTLFYGGVFVGA